VRRWPTFLLLLGLRLFLACRSESRGDALSLLANLSSLENDEHLIWLRAGASSFGRGVKGDGMGYRVTAKGDEARVPC